MKPLKDKLRKGRVMNQSIKAALLSALVFPGVGQIAIGHKKRGWLVVGFVVVLLYLIFSEAMKIAYTIVEEIQKSGAPINAAEISKATSEMVGFSDNMFLNISLIILILTWLASIIDAYWVGKKINTKL
jgi:TM2 domain-containing membrane protein YozV